MHVHQDSVYQNIKGWKGAPVEDSLIKWRKKCCGTEFSVLTLLFCVRAGGCARALLAVARSPSPCLPSVERRYMLPSSVCPFSFISHWSSCNIRETVHKSWDPGKSLPWLKWKRLVHCVFEWRAVCFQRVPTMASYFQEWRKKCLNILGWNAFRINGEIFLFFIFFKSSSLKV